MSLFGGVVSITSITYFMFAIFVIAVFGYFLGRVNIKGVSLGTAGVFIVALLFGGLFSGFINEQLVIELANGEKQCYTTNALKIVENIGLVLFVTSVGYIAGPNFFKNFKKNYKSYILLGFIIILSGALACVLCFYIGQGSEPDKKQFVALLSGLLSGALTSTPALSAAKETVAEGYKDAVAVGSGIAYLFGVVGVVLFVQLIPKIIKADMKKEVALLDYVDTGKKENKTSKKLIDIDTYGLGAFSIAVALGILIGGIKIPLSAKGLSGTTFSLTTTGGSLLVALVLGHFGRIGRINFKINPQILKVFRELGLMLFLIGAGVAGGVKFVQYFKPVYFLYGIIMTTLPMIIGYIFARKILKLSLLNTLGSITGGMTSTPALGTLINVAGTDDVASAYAATYPVALIAVVLATQFFIILFG